MGKGNKYTKEEIDKMIKLYNDGYSCKKIAGILHRNDSSVRNKLKEFGVFKYKNNAISDEELKNLIIDYKSGMRPCELAEKYNRNSGTIISRLKYIGVYIDSRNNYTKEDEEFLRICYLNNDWENIFQRFPTATKQNIISKMSKMGIKHPSKWTEYELQYLKDNYYIKSLDEIETALGYSRTKDAIQTKALKYFGYSKDRSWTKDETEIMLNYYDNKTVNNMCELLPNRSRGAIIAHAKVMGLTSLSILDVQWSQEDSDKLIKIWDKYTDEELSNIFNKDIKTIKNKRWSLGLKRIGIDNGEYADLKKYLRGQIWSWKSESMKNCNYKCVITGSSDFHIHHLFSFNDILNKFLFDNSIEYKDISDYTSDELCEIQNLFLEEHNKYPLGVCLRKDIHVLYHNMYGKTNISPEQFDKFRNDYMLGMY